MHLLSSAVQLDIIDTTTRPRQLTNSSNVPESIKARIEAELIPALLSHYKYADFDPSCMYHDV